ncbi:MAG TPA: 2-dehydropantoate 2-reductase N-terminal domain-containing protein [Myxococcota bacterium]|nr:2-dehydropantoate 2-reductase N-terminal domain-containing protein [Myxococcota bacterium]
MTRGPERSIAIVGAGAVGLVAGARLASAGRAVRFFVRSQEAADAIKRDGVRLEDPGSGEVVRACAEATLGFGHEAAAASSVALLCVRSCDTELVAPAIGLAFSQVPVACVQNHVVNEATLAKYVPRVLGVVWRQTCTRVAPNAAVTLGRGRVVLGAYPEGGGEDVDALAGDFRDAGFDVGVSQRIAEDKWLKLCINLMSTPNALVRPRDHVTQTFVETKARLLEEARAVLDAAGIPARSCDGRDRSLDQEIVFQRASLAQGTSARRLPVYNQTWTALRDRRAVEADQYHRVILELGRRHGIPTPVNTRVLQMLERARDEGWGPECLAANQLLEQG